MKMKNLIVMFATVLSIQAFADPAPSTTGSPWTKKITASYFGQFSSTSIGSPSRYTPSLSDAKGSDTINLYNATNIGYKITDEWTLKFSERFVYRPVGTIPAAGMGLKPVDSHGMDLQQLNDRIYVEKANFINSNGFNTKVSAGLEVPTEVKSRESYHMIVSPRVTAGNSFTLPNSRWSFGLNLMFQGYIHSQYLIKQKDFESYWDWNVVYKITDRLSATAEYEGYGAHKRIDSLGTWNQDGTDAHIGVAYNITSKLTINPYIQLMPGGKLDMDTTSLGMFIIGSIL